LGNETAAKRNIYERAPQFLFRHFFLVLIKKHEMGDLIKHEMGDLIKHEMGRYQEVTCTLQSTI
jgi:hypothetical protein